MKSIREWMVERGIVGEDFDKNAFARYMGSSSVKVNRDLELELRPKVRRIMDMDKFRSMSPDSLLDGMKAVISQTVAEMGGQTISTRSLAKELGSDEEGSRVDVSKFARMMGSERMDIDSDLRRELKPKIERIMDMEQYKSMPKEELEKELVAVVAKIVAGISGSAISAGEIEKQIEVPEDETIAKENFSVPSFLRWAEENEADQSGVSEPQHKQGEKDMDLKSVVEKKMMEIAEELEQDGKGSRQDVLAAMKAVIDSASKEQPQKGPRQNNQGDAGQAPQAGPQNDGGQPQPAPAAGGGQQPPAPQG